MKMSDIFHMKEIEPQLRLIFTSAAAALPDGQFNFLRSTWGTENVTYALWPYGFS